MNEWEWQVLEDRKPVDRVLIFGVEVKAGDRVRLFPHKGGDILDIALRGQIATVECIEQDYDGRSHIGVVLDDDPGRDLGLLRQPGHRFFFDTAEVEPLPEHERHRKHVVEAPRVLVAGIGNIFLGDDGFGVAVAQRLTRSGLPSTVRVTDFGLRGFDLVYALQDRYEGIILIDAFSHGEPPGTVYVVEADLDQPPAEFAQENFVQPHAMNPINVLRMAAAMYGPLHRVVLVGCEPASFGGEEGKMGLSAPVEAAVEEAARVVTKLVDRMLDETQLNAAN
jgi:hydrogenase maturation protease